MPISRYLPSLKLVSIIASLALSIGLVYAADNLTRHEPPTVSVDSVSNTALNSNWQAALDAIQAQNASSTFSEPDPNFVNTLLSSAQSANITETVGKTILVNLSAAKSQGLGGDIPTQDQIVAAATAQLKTQQADAIIYTANDLTVTSVSNTTLHDYGNKVMQAVNKHTEAREQATLLAIDYLVEAGDKSQVGRLTAIGAAYKAIAQDLALVPVPQTLVPLHLALVNVFLRISSTYIDMKTMDTDPLRGLVALQTYQSLMDEGAGVFTNIAQSLNRGGILFTKDESGAAWAVFLGTTP